MAIFRKINCDYWQDEKVVDEFTPEDRYFMLYLMTNPHTNQVGCYQLTIRQMEFETGYNKDTILKLIKRFSETLQVIFYDENTKEVLIKNWHKYNWTSSPKIIACITKELETVKSSEFRNHIDTLFIEYGYSIDTVDILKRNKNKNKNKNKEEEEKEYIEETKNKKFIKPTLKEIENYCLERKNNVNPDQFFDFYETKNWYIGKNKMANWQAAIRNWERNSKQQNTQNNNQIKENIEVWNL